MINLLARRFYDLYEGDHNSKNKIVEDMSYFRTSKIVIIIIIVTKCNELS